MSLPSCAGVGLERRERHSRHRTVAVAEISVVGLDDRRGAVDRPHALGGRPFHPVLRRLLPDRVVAPAVDLHEVDEAGEHARVAIRLQVLRGPRLLGRHGGSGLQDAVGALRASGVLAAGQRGEHAAEDRRDRGDQRERAQRAPGAPLRRPQLVGRGEQAGDLLVRGLEVAQLRQPLAQVGVRRLHGGSGRRVRWRPGSPRRRRAGGRGRCAPPRAAGPPGAPRRGPRAAGCPPTSLRRAASRAVREGGRPAAAIVLPRTAIGRKSQDGCGRRWAIRTAASGRSLGALAAQSEARAWTTGPG
jgi:hypothetical protein